MTDHTIQNFVYCLIDLEKNLRLIEEYREKEYIALQSMNVLSLNMRHMCHNLEMKSHFYDQAQYKDQE